MDSIRKSIIVILILCVLLLAACSSGPSAEDESATRTAMAGTAFAVAYTEAAQQVQAQPDAATETPPAPPTGVPATLEPTIEPVSFQTYVWNIEVVDEGKVGLFPHLVIDAEDRPNTVYLDDNRDILKLAKTREDGSWLIQTFDSPNNDGYYGSLDFDAAGTPHICRFIHNLEYIAYINWTGSTWDVGPFITNVSAADTTLQVDGDYKPHIVYFDKLSSELRYARLEAVSWSTQIIASTTEEGVTYPFVLDEAGQVHVAYYDPTQGLVYALYSGGNWGYQVIDPGAGVGLYPSLALDSTGQAHMSYYDSAAQALKHAFWNGVMWEIQIVDTTGFHTSIALDAQDFVHISYFDQTENDLKYALGSNNQWVVYVVDSGGNVGMYSSLALDSQGNPKISYFDKSNRSLKFASAARQ